MSVHVCPQYAARLSENAGGDVVLFVLLRARSRGSPMSVWHCFFQRDDNGRRKQSCRPTRLLGPRGLQHHLVCLPANQTEYRGVKSEERYYQWVGVSHDSFREVYQGRYGGIYRSRTHRQYILCGQRVYVKLEQGGT